MSSVNIQRGLSGSSDPHCEVWLPEIVQILAALLPPNEVALTLRLVNKATAAQFRGPQHATVRLSQPVPHHAFAWRWAGPDAMRSLTSRQRYSLPQLTARSGSVTNLQVLLARGEVAGPLGPDVLGAAAHAGHVGVCGWLRAQGCACGEPAFVQAAAGGQQAACEWLLASGCVRDSDYGAAAAAAVAAAEQGHADLVDWLLLRAVSMDTRVVGHLMRALAAGCDLPALQRRYRAYVACSDGSSGDDEVWHVDDEVEPWGVLAAAAGSGTGCWQAKVEWLEVRGLERGADACVAAASRPDALSRLVWLRQRGYPLSDQVVIVAARLGSVGALQYVLDQRGDAEAAERSVPFMEAAAHGRVAAMELLVARGAPIGPDAVRMAAQGGHLPAVAWLVERLGAATALTPCVFNAAAMSGSLQLLVWLQEHGCRWDEWTFASAAEQGSEEQLEWLAAHGCPMGDQGSPYTVPASTGDLSTLRCLRRLGCPWSPDGSTFTRALVCLCLRAKDGFTAHARRSLCWLLDQGCPVRWGVVDMSAMRGVPHGLAEWVREQRERRT